MVLCPPDDEPALWAYQGLKDRGLEPLELVRADMLEHGVRWEHRVGSKGASINITLADGRSFSSHSLRGVLNRLSWPPLETLSQVDMGDREYAMHELHAFFTSWLYALPWPVLNRPTPQGLSGSWRHLSEWVWLASKAGLPTPDYRLSSCDPFDRTTVQARLVPLERPVSTVFVIDNHLVGASAPLRLRRGCRRLARLAGTALIGIEFSGVSTGEWSFVGATTLPDLRIGGETLLDVLASALKGEGGLKK